MGLFDRFRRAKPPATGHGTLDRQASDKDRAELQDFVRSRSGVEFYLEPRTNMTMTTVLAIAADGEWIRRRVASGSDAGRLAGKLNVPLYEAIKMGYPQRMRDWNAAHPERRMR